LVWAYSRRGKVITRADVSDRCNKGTVYMTYQWWIGKCNDLTMHQTDPLSGTPEDKFSACEVEAIDDQTWAELHLQDLYSSLKKRLADEAAPQNVPAKSERVLTTA
jgi:formate dehydrogenase major subunit